MHEQYRRNMIVSTLLAIILGVIASTYWYHGMPFLAMIGYAAAIANVVFALTWRLKGQVSKTVCPHCKKGKRHEKTGRYDGKETFEHMVEYECDICSTTWTEIS